ncbi:hypothetical protein RFF05_12885 [Bengtsoniella intestinalis]|uniref:hypothetical protein n=1 Tax=Bengtsoniella intestinalis TaxID=3073143 RepID=UPI00391FC480
MNQLYVLTDKKAEVVTEHTYEAELELQTIVTENPHLLLAPSSAKQLFLIEPEFTLPEDEGSSNSFSLDHLMVDSDGVPALVEVKRSKDTRIRREVVAQMMDYAARMRCVDVDSLRTLFQDENQEEGLEEYYTDEFWEKVSANLKADRMALYFVADEIPSTLVTMMDFMRRTMSGIAVYGVEIKEYQSDGTVLLSSSVIGGYEPEPIQVGQEWDATSFGAQMRCLHDDGLIDVAKNLQTNCAGLGYTILFGRGMKRPSFRGVVGKTTVFQVAISAYEAQPKCSIEICLPLMQRALGHESDEKLRTLFNDFPDKEKAIEDENIRNTPQYLYYTLSYFKNSQRLKELLEKLAAVEAELAN